ncbi:MAG: 2-C-methyl-D-erythritol 4-phosphate cytidylyltransferase [Planctomycetes bacterium]|nr:2-C-methyl-D-erythritol 4-phosphate cytidylyltransferase [Planctomycetota bacterium]
MSDVAVLICASGSSDRFGGKTKKQFEDVNGRAVFLRSLEAFSDRDDVKQIIVAIPAEDEEIFNIKWADKLGFYGVRHILGGSQRYETVEKLLAEVKEGMELVAIHDAARPCVTEKQIDAVFSAAAKTGAAILARRLDGTIKKVDANLTISQTVDRRGLFEAQTPQVFKTDIIRKAYQQRDPSNKQITDDAQLVEAIGQPVTVVEGDSSNLKITNRSDLTLAATILKSQQKPKSKTGPAGPWAAEQAW